MESEKNVVAVFDFDGTLTTKDSFFRFLYFISVDNQFYWRMLRTIPAFTSYGMGIIDNHTAKEQVIKIFLKGVSEVRLKEASVHYAEKIIPLSMREEAIKKVKWHQSRQHKIIVVSASLESYLEPWCRMMNINYLAGTKLEYINGVVSGKISGKNCQGIEKVNRLKQILGREGKHKIYAYGNSAGDKALLAMADVAYFRKFN